MQPGWQVYRCLGYIIICTTITWYHVIPILPLQYSCEPKPHSFVYHGWIHKYKIHRHCVSRCRSCRKWESCSSDLSRALSTSCNSIAYPVRKVTQRLRERGTFTVNRADCGASRRRHTSIIEEDVLHRIEETPLTSTRTVERVMGVSHSTVWKVLHEQQLLPYHPERVHGMGPPDFALCATFCMWFLHHCGRASVFTTATFRH